MKEIVIKIKGEQFTLREKRINEGKKLDSWRGKDEKWKKDYETELQRQGVSTPADIGDTVEIFNLTRNDYSVRTSRSTSSSLGSKSPEYFEGLTGLVVGKGRRWFLIQLDDGTGNIYVKSPHVKKVLIGEGSDFEGEGMFTNE